MKNASIAPLQPQGHSIRYRELMSNKRAVKVEYNIEMIE